MALADILDPPWWALLAVILGTIAYVVVFWPLFNRFLNLGPPLGKLEKHFWRKYVFWFWFSENDEGEPHSDRADQ